MLEPPDRNRKQEPSLDFQARGEKILKQHCSDPPSEDCINTRWGSLCTWCRAISSHRSPDCAYYSIRHNDSLCRDLFHGNCDCFLGNDLLPRPTCEFCRHMNPKHFVKCASSSDDDDDGYLAIRSRVPLNEDALDELAGLDEPDECQLCIFMATWSRHANVSKVFLELVRTKSGNSVLCLDGYMHDSGPTDLRVMPSITCKISPHPWPQIGAKVDWNRIRTWPLVASEEIYDLPNKFRVIDLVRNCIVCPKDPVHYVALSYVWGRTSGKEFQATLRNIEQLELEGSLSRIQLPRTIQDAIFTCHQLGQRYLWIDRLCILQDDKESKHGQIARMDSIFGAAVFTIVALTGSDSQSGLAGVSMLRHTRLNALEWPHFNVIEPVLLTDLVARSPWNKRGWTFQEELCSGSSLYFTDYGVYHSRYQPNRYSWETTSEFYSHPKMGTSKNFNVIFPLIEEYSKRLFSFQDDVLRAFTGVLNMLHGDKHHFGVPFDSFTWGIHWQPLDWTCQKRASLSETFPSWSWSSVQGPIKFIWFDDPLALWARPVVPEPGKNEELRWISINDEAAHLKSLTIDAGIICAPAFLFNSQFGKRYSPLSPSTLSVFEGHDRKRAHESPGRLLSFTQVAIFTIRNLNYHCSDGDRPFSIRSVQDEHVGDIELTASSSEELKGGSGLLREEPFEFLALGYGRQEARLLACNYGMQHEPGMSCHDSVNVMLILRDEVSGVARRVGIGKVLKKAWLEARPELKTVVLE